MSIKQTQMAYEKRYSDDSGVEHGVYFNANDDPVGVHIVADGEGIAFPLERIKWLREALFEIVREQGYEY